MQHEDSESRNMTIEQGARLVDRATGCFLGALLGDALGTRTEGLEPAIIKERFGWVDRFEQGSGGTDDTFVKDMLAQVLIATDGEARSRDWAAAWRQRADAILSPGFRNKFFISILQTTYKLRLGVDATVASAGNLPSSTAAMAIAPVGVVNAGHPRAAAAQAWELASLLHPPEVAFCRDAAAIVAAVVSEAAAGSASPDAAIDLGLCSLWSTHDGATLVALASSAVALAESSDSYDAFRTAYHGSFRQDILCDSRETVPAALALVVLARGDLATALSYAANFGRDTDTIGAIVGAICGALQGCSALPKEWLSLLPPESVREQRRLANELVEAHWRKASREVAAWSRTRKEIRSSETGHDTAATDEPTALNESATWPPDPYP